MSQLTVYIALQQFCQTDRRPEQLLKEAGFHVIPNTLGRRLHREELMELLQKADAVVAGVEPYDAQVLQALPRLRCIGRCGSGTDAIDLEAAERLGIAVYTTPEEVAEPVAQLTVAMILALARNLPLHLADAQHGTWRKRTGFLLSEWTIGLIGFGQIGQAVQRYLERFGPRILVTDPAWEHQRLPEAVQWRPLDALLREADLVSLHVNRARAAGAVLGERELELMRPGSYLVNTARGYLLNEHALYTRLQSGHLAGAALDVFETEPYEGPLARLPQVVCTPHIATLTRASRAAMEFRCAQQLIDHFTTKPVRRSGRRELAV